MLVLQNNLAYTFLEIIIVLLITSALFFIFSFSYIKILDNQSVLNSIDIFKAAYDKVRATSITSNSKNRLIIDNNKKEITIYIDDNKEVKKYPSRVDITSNYGTENYQEIKINKRGNISKAGSLKFQSGKKKAEVSLSIGLGGYNEK